jgi:hypothetical protein
MAAVERTGILPARLVIPGFDVRSVVARGEKSCGGFAAGDGRATAIIYNGCLSRERAGQKGKKPKRHARGDVRRP